ncbi:MAG: DUF1365 domain-containing protein [Pseudomonadota bacterium]
MPPSDAPDAETLPSDSGTTACLYQGHVMHMRMTPFAHKFRYRVFSMLLDIDRLEETCRPLRLLSLDRFNLLSFHRRDHADRDGSALRPWVEAQLAAHERPVPHRIWLLSFPRILGYAFNPLSVYFCENASGDLESVVYEVKNTFGDQHPYVVDATADGDGASRHGHGKGFFVSPFIGMDQTYRFTLRQPGARLALKIRQHDGDGPWLIATQSGVRRPLTDRALLAQWAMHPLMTVKVITAIHWQALKLWLKGATFHRYRGPYPDQSEQPAETAAKPAAVAN